MILSSIRKLRAVWEAGKQILQSEQIEQKKFLGYIEVAKEVAKQDKTQLQTLVNLIARKPQAELLTQFVIEKRGGSFKRGEAHHLLFSGYAHIDDNDTYLCDVWIEKEISDVPISLAEYVVLPWPWNADRIVNCFSWIGTKERPWKFDESNHFVEIYFPFNIGFVSSGNHSLTTGIIKGQGVIERYKLIDLSPVYNHIYCDGFYYRRKIDNIPIEKVNDKYIAAIFEIGRLMIEGE